jgi:hypothetical protein
LQYINIENISHFENYLQAIGGLFQVTGGLDLVVNQVGNIVYEEIEKEQESKLKIMYLNG